METYVGHVRTPADAIKLFEACRLGLLPRVQRRLSEKERQSIKSGSVFVWDEREAGMRRWTDGKSWSASRVSGSFLTYREMEGKRGGGSFVPPPARRVPGKTPDSGRGSDEDMDMDGEGPDGYRYKPDGLMKQSFSITTSNGQHLHLISYFARPHANAPELLQPTTDPALRHIVPVKGMYPESTVHEQAQGPAVTRAPMQSAYMNSPSHGGHQAHGPPRPPYPYQQVSAGYSWPPSPVATPPYSGYPPGIYSSSLPPPPPGSAHASPHQHPHQYSPHHPPHLQHHPSAGGPQQTAFDRAPPPLQDSSLPPPPPMLHQQHPSQRLPVTGPPPPNHLNAPLYAPNPSPRIAQARQIAEQQANQQHQAQAQAQQQHSQAMQAAQQQAALAQRIALQVMSAQDTRPQQLPHETRTTLAPVNPSITSDPRMDDRDRKDDRPNRSPTSQTIPSISSLVHATDSPPLSSVNGTSNGNPNSGSTMANGAGEAKNSSRNGSLSPGHKGANGNSGENAPRDISLSKMGQGVFGNEDNRALRVLDRKFCI